MRTITLVGYNRIGYMAQAIGALVECRGIETFDKLIISVEPGCSEVIEMCHRAAKMLSDGGVIDVEVYENIQRLGVAWNPFVALCRAFEIHGSDFNLAIEDDALLRPDAIDVLNWFESNHGGPTSEYTLMSMCNHKEYFMPEVVKYPDSVVESDHITSPFAWACTKHQFPFIKSAWNFKTVPPLGWDWSLSMAMRLESRKAVHPMLSRCQNIGRENGTNETPETFDKTQLHLPYSDGSYSGEFVFDLKILNGDVRELNNWMLPEYCDKLFPLKGITT